MRVYRYMYACVLVYVCVCICIRMRVYRYMYACVLVYVCVCIGICMNVSVCEVFIGCKLQLVTLQTCIFIYEYNYFFIEFLYTVDKYIHTYIRTHIRTHATYTYMMTYDLCTQCTITSSRTTIAY